MCSPQNRCGKHICACACLLSNTFILLTLATVNSAPRFRRSRALLFSLEREKQCLSHATHNFDPGNIATKHNLHEDAFSLVQVCKLFSFQCLISLRHDIRCLHTKHTERIKRYSCISNKNNLNVITCFWHNFSDAFSDF